MRRSCIWLALVALALTAVTVSAAATTPERKIVLPTLDDTGSASFAPQVNLTQFKVKPVIDPTLVHDAPLARPARSNRWRRWLQQETQPARHAPTRVQSIEESSWGPAPGAAASTRVQSIEESSWGPAPATAAASSSRVQSIEESSWGPAPTPAEPMPSSPSMPQVRNRLMDAFSNARRWGQNLLAKAGWQPADRKKLADKAKPSPPTFQPSAALQALRQAVGFPTQTQAPKPPKVRTAAPTADVRAAWEAAFRT